MDLNFNDWKKLVGNKKFKSAFGEMKGDKVLTAPKNFAKDNTAIKLIRHKQFYFEHRFTDKEVLSRDFLQNINQTFKTLRPYFNYMSEVLTTDANGISLV